MIKIKIKRKDDKISSIEAKGHACSAPHGKDIVCSAVSVLFETVGLALEECGFSDFYEQKNGYMKIYIPKFHSEQESEKCNFFLDIVVKSLKEITLEYPKNITYQEESETIKKK